MRDDGPGRVDGRRQPRPRTRWPDVAKQGIWLDHGRVRQIGPIDDIIPAYKKSVQRPRRRRRNLLHVRPAAQNLCRTKDQPVILDHPLLFDSYLRPMVWGPPAGGGFRKPLPDSGPYGEAWEVTDHASHSSRVSRGPLEGRTLRELMTHSCASRCSDPPHADTRLSHSW